jgi:endonuclease-3
MLSSQTKDEVTSATMNYLIKEKGFSIEMVMKTSEKDLNEYISAVGFHNKKAKYIKDTTKIIVDKYKGIVPQKLDELLDFPGVGPKMAHLLLQISFD